MPLQPGATDLPIVLDASAVLAAIQGEPGWEVVWPRLDLGGARVGAVNWSEVFAKLVDRNLADAQASQVIGRLPITIEPFTADDARQAGALRRLTRSVGLSFGDRACLALAYRLSAVVLTADKAWSRVDVGIAIQQIR